MQKWLQGVLLIYNTPAAVSLAGVLQRASADRRGSVETFPAAAAHFRKPSVQGKNSKSMPTICDAVFAGIVVALLNKHILGENYFVLPLVVVRLSKMTSTMSAHRRPVPP